MSAAGRVSAVIFLIIWTTLATLNVQLIAMGRADWQVGVFLMMNVALVIINARDLIVPPAPPNSATKLGDTKA